MSSGDTARNNFNAARSELLAHFSLRDNVLLGYIAATGTILTIALGTSAKPEILLAIPYLALGVSVLISQHNLLIGTLLDFISEEIEPFFRKLSPPEDAPQYTSSAPYKASAINALRLRFWGHLAIVLVPCVISIYFNWALAKFPMSLLGSIWWFCLISILFTIFLLIKVHMFRVKQVRHRFKST